MYTSLMKSSTKNLYSLFLMVLFISIVFSCVERKEANDNTVGTEKILVDVSEINTLKYSSIFELDTLIFLNSDNLLSSVRKVELINDSLAILSFTKGFEGILLKNLKTGEEIVINQKGEAPHEFNRITNFIYSDLDSSIYVLDAGSSKVLQFDLKGKFLQYWKSDYLTGAQSIKHLGNNKIAVYAGNFYYGTVDYQLIYLNLATDELLNKFIEIDPNRAKFMLFFGEDNFYHSNDFFTAAHNNVIYRLKSSEIEPKYYISFGERDIPEDVINQNHKDVRAYFGKLQELNYPYGLSNISLTDRWLYFSFSFNSMLVGTFYNFETERAILYNKIDNDIFGFHMSKNLTYHDLPLTMINKKIVFSLEPSDQLTYLNKMKQDLSIPAYNQFKRKNLKWITMLEKLGDDANPVLAIVKLK